MTKNTGIMQQAESRSQFKSIVSGQFSGWDGLGGVGEAPGCWLGRDRERWMNSERSAELACE